MGALINGSTNCNLCNYVINYVGNLGSSKIIDSPDVYAESVVATGRFTSSEGVNTDLEIIVECPNCSAKNKTTHSIKSIS